MNVWTEPELQPVESVGALSKNGQANNRSVLSDAQAVQVAADALAAGGIVAQAFANFYVITTRPDELTVRRVNLMKGRPADQVGSITTTPARLPLVYDWSQLPAGLTREDVCGLIDALFTIGPFGFRGPAAGHIPHHLTQDDDGITTAQVIAPGYACPSNRFLARSLEAIDEDILYITSANRSRHLTGADDEPAHYRADGLRAEFGHEPGFMVLEHDDEEEANQRTYPLYAPMSTTILALHKVAGHDEQGRLRLVVERHGSLPVDHLREVVGRLGFGLVLGANATHRLLQRDYDRLEGERVGR
jgi:tRNA A37 threonylcarbamoyladenosine synthetase subunit TsaC/SUA5/YrdC